MSTAIPAQIVDAQRRMRKTPTGTYAGHNGERHNQPRADNVASK
jgi:hypothetical protein